MADYGPKPILCLDFDGVLHAYTSGWQGAGKVTDGPVEGAMQFLIDATPEFRICIYSTRSNTYEGRTAMQTALRFWLCEAGADWTIFDHLEFPESKPPAMVTIDDRAITFTGTFPEVKELLAFKPWNKGGNTCRPITPTSPVSTEPDSPLRKFFSSPNETSRPRTYDGLGDFRAWIRYTYHQVKKRGRPVLVARTDR